MKWLPFILLPGCATLDGFVHGGVPCSQVGTPTCEDVEEVWDKVCVPCDEAYDWSKTFDWMTGTLDEGESIRSPDPDTVVQFSIPTTDGAGELDAYFIPAHGDEAALASTTVIYNHGNYAGIEHYQPRVHMAHEVGFNVLVWGYRGYGKSQPESAPTPEQFMADSVQVRDVADDYAPDPSRVIPYAFSLGGIPAMEMAAERENCALILEAAFTSLGHIMENNTATGLPASFLSTGDFEAKEKMARYQGPVLAMLGTEDRKFTVDSWNDILEAATGPKEFWVLEGVDHGIASGGIPEAGFTAYADKLKSFLATHAPDCIEAE